MRSSGLSAALGGGERLNPHFLFETSKRKSPFTVKRKDVGAYRHLRFVFLCLAVVTAQQN